jgi:cation diffusion facilitator family transporter
LSANGGPKAVIAALAANLGIALTKLVAWALTGASSMLAEAVHSFADSGNQALLLVGGHRAKRAETPEHPFGYGRERYVYAFLVSIVLFTLGGLFALYEAYHKYRDVHAGRENELLVSRWWWVPLVVLVAAILMESLSFRTAIAESNKVRDGLSWARFVRNAKAPELPVVLLEDLAALVGLTFALAGVGLTLLTENGYWDAAGTAAIGLLLVTVAIVLGGETKSLLLGESATTHEQELIRSRLLADDNVLDVISLRTLHLGPDSILVACKVSVRPTDSARVISDTIHASEQSIRVAVPSATHIFIEPDIFRTPVDSSA